MENKLGNGKFCPHQGKEHGIGPFGTLTLNTLRLEKGFKMWGNEMNLDLDLLEAGLGVFAHWKKEVDYVGRAALERARHEWRTAKLVMMEVDSRDADPDGNETVYMEGKVGERAFM